jgi:hypothetical protein
MVFFRHHPSYLPIDNRHHNVIGSLHHNVAASDACHDRVRTGKLMQHAPTLPKDVVGKPFGREIAVAWAAAHRHDGIRLAVATDLETFPEVIEISPPGTTEPRWCIWQDTLGRHVVDNWHTWEPSRLFAGMADALDFIAEEIGTVNHSRWHLGLRRAPAPTEVAANQGE